MNRVSRSMAPVSFCLLAAVVGCSSSDDGSSTKVSIGTATASDATIELLTDTRLETGMTPIYIRATTADGKDIADATVSFVPLMTMMGGMTHSAPVVEAPVRGTDGLFHCDVVFQMASGEGNSWGAAVGLTRPGHANAEAKFEALTVVDSGRGMPFAYTDPSTSEKTKYVVSMNFEEAPKVGLNPVVVTLHKMQDMMTFVPVDDATLALDPQMPSMGHGAPGSVNPTATSDGQYEGQVSFSMAGTWETTLTVIQGGVTLGTPKFTTTF